MFGSKKSIFDKINDYLIKKGHELVMSVYLNNYNPKKLDDYINSQMVTKFIAVKLIDLLNKINIDSDYILNDKIIGDRVEIVMYLKETPREYVFDRFLPLKWEPFIDLLAIIFSYLPRGMEVFLHEIFAKFDGAEERFNCSKPVKFDLLLDDLNEIFRKMVVSRGEKVFEDNKVKFIEKQEDDYYIGLVDEEDKSFVPVIKKIDDEHVFMHCNCKCDYYCKHIYAMIKSIRQNKFNGFYKVRYVGKEESLLEKVTISNFYLCFGIKEGKLLLINDDGTIFPCDVIQKGKVAFEVLEDDDECSLSKQINELKEK